MDSNIVLYRFKIIKRKIINKLDKDWEWDFGISFTDAMKKFKNSRFVTIVNRIFITIFATCASGLMAFSLFMLFLAYPAFVAILLVIDLMVTVLVFYEYNGLLEDIKQCLKDIIKNAQLKKIKN